MDLETEYNNRAKVPDPLAIIADWNRRAAAFRAVHPNAETLPYGPGARNVMDLFWPGTTHDAPLALFIHGGYWQSLDGRTSSHLAAGLLAHGVAVAVPSYDLCPHVTLAAIVDQLRDVAALLARRHGRPLLAIGHSAGGHLAAMLMATDWTARGLAGPVVRSAIGLSGLYDLTPLIHTSINIPLGLDDAEARRLSPLFLPPPMQANGAGRIHAVVGGHEGPEYERQSRSIAAAWNGSCELVPAADHFTIIEPLTDPGSTLVSTALDLIA